MGTSDREFGRYMEVLSKNRSPSNNPYSHAEGLMENEPGEVKNHSQVFDKQALLAIIKDDETMRIYQRELEYLIKLYDMSLRDKRLANLFLTLRAKLYSELGITRAMEGEERKHQAELGGYISPQDMRGYGATAQEQDEAGQLQQLKDFIANLKRG